MADSAVGTMNGSKTTARVKDLNAIFWFSRIASHKPSANLMVLATIV